MVRRGGWLRQVRVWRLLFCDTVRAVGRSLDVDTFQLQHVRQQLAALRRADGRVLHAVLLHQRLQLLHATRNS